MKLFAHTLVLSLLASGALAAPQAHGPDHYDGQALAGQAKVSLA